MLKSGQIVVKLFLISEKTSLVFHAGKRKVTLNREMLQKFRAERTQRIASTEVT